MTARRLALKNFSVLLLLFMLGLSSRSSSSQPIPAPQTARQALMEMFFSKTPGTFVKHLPIATLNALEKSGAFDNLQQYSMLASQLHSSGGQFETFETGSVLLSTQDPKTGNKIDIILENDSLQGDDDNLELSFQTYKDKQAQRTPYMPSMTFAMKMESGVWKLNEITLTVRLPLADPDFLKGITEQIKNNPLGATAQIKSAQMQNGSMQVNQGTTTYGSEASVKTAMRSILAAEATYKSTYANVGYTCTLADLDGFGGGQPNEHQAMLISSSLAGGRRFGYSFKLSGCTGNPATNFQLVATPSGNALGKPTFCSDHSGVLRSSSENNADKCFASGIPAQ